MKPPLGLLLVMMEPPAEHAEEFDAWYSTEHLPQRLSMPGFLNGTRWKCVDGWPEWLALYDLESLAALETPEYLAVSGTRSTPWTRRVLGFVKGYRRVAAMQLKPGNELIAPEIEKLMVRQGITEAPAGARLVQCRWYSDEWVIAGYESDAQLVRPDGAKLWNVYVRDNF